VLLQLLSLTDLVFSFRIMHFLILSFYLVPIFFLKAGFRCPSASIYLLPSTVTFDNNFFFREYIGPFENDIGHNKVFLLFVVIIFYYSIVYTNIFPNNIS
jgi:hypothetical protein